MGGWRRRARAGAVVFGQSITILNETQSTGDGVPFDALRRIQRSTDITIHNVKLIVRPDTVKRMHVHSVLDFEPVTSGANQVVYCCECIFCGQLLVHPQIQDNGVTTLSRFHSVPI